jgi:hypothetical protein
VHGTSEKFARPQRRPDQLQSLAVSRTNAFSNFFTKNCVVLGVYSVALGAESRGSTEPRFSGSWSIFGCRAVIGFTCRRQFREREVARSRSDGSSTSSSAWPTSFDSATKYQKYRELKGFGVMYLREVAGTGLTGEGK